MGRFTATKANAARLTSIFSTLRSARPTNIVNPQLCKDAIKWANLSAYASTKPILIDMNPGACVWSAALHDYLKPRNHILLEPEIRYAPFIEEFVTKRPRSHWLPLDGYSWDTYTKLFTPDPSPPPLSVEGSVLPLNPKFVPPEDGVNTDILFTGNLSSSKGEQLIAQFLSCTPLGQWVQRFGRVRFLLWVQDTIKDRYLPRGIGGRNRPAVNAETVCSLHEIASSPIKRTGKGHPRSAEFKFDEQGNIVLPNPRRTKGRPKRVKEADKVSEEDWKNVSAVKGEPRKLPMSIEEIEELLERIENAHEDEASLKKFEEEFIGLETIPKKERQDKENAEETPENATENQIVVENAAEDLKAEPPKKKRGRKPSEASKKKKEQAALSKMRKLRRNMRPIVTPALERIRISLLEMAKQSRGSTEDATITKLLNKINEKDRSVVRQKQRVITNLTDILERGEDRWLAGMEHPPWWYKKNSKGISSWAEVIMRDHAKHRANVEHSIQLGDDDTAKQIAALESFEEPDDKAVSKGGGASSFEEYEERWGRKKDNISLLHSQEDEVLSYQKKLLQWHKRKSDPLPVEKEDFWPTMPLALLDFTPILTDEYFRPSTHEERDKNWEIYQWLLRGLFGLRAHNVSSGLGALVPGGEHLLDEVDEVAAGGKIDPKARIRTLDVKQLVEITKAWNNWPFKTEDAHQELWEDWSGITSERGKKK